MNITNIIAIAIAAGVANAGIVRVDEFESSIFEGFQDLEMSTFESNPVSVFDGLAEIRNTGGSWLHTTGAWGFANRTSALEGDKLLGNTSGGIEYLFNTNFNKFGGYFATISSVEDGQVRFYHGETLIGSDIVNADVGGQWSWNGWESQVGFNRIVVESNYGNSGGFIMHDSVRVANTIPVPSSLAITGFAGIVGTRRRRTET